MRLWCFHQRRVTRVRNIVTFDGELAEATAPLSVSLTLEDEVDISRGDLLVAPDKPASITRRFKRLAGLDGRSNRSISSRRYLLKHTSRSVTAQISTLHHSVDIASFDEHTATTLTMNGIGLVEVNTLQPLAVDRYAENRITGSFVLIDTETNATAAAGMIREVLSDGRSPDEGHQQIPVNTDERITRWDMRELSSHSAALSLLADAVERALFLKGAFVVQVNHVVATALAQAGVLAITLDSRNESALNAQIGEDRVTPLNGDGPACSCRSSCGTAPQQKHSARS